uniref:Uncharacterized protein n=1 Tax=Anguilla anguilla TaxID=7936 RepID=A0A0E9UZW1_ANGAN
MRYGNAIASSLVFKAFPKNTFSLKYKFYSYSFALV